MKTALPELNTLIAAFAERPFQANSDDNLIRAAKAAQQLLPFMQQAGIVEAELGIAAFIADLLHLQHYLHLNQQSEHTIDRVVQLAFLHFDVDTQ
ncbi:Uncharacterised protein [Serratia proteamaculans]|uniref:hypothetical protein n=1 Tax=Serratia proteamaculans TaxID=28151 RepID=UPI00217C609A|nr:hypothetical protein [Serratia proteamaculans]CAI1965403.1 Uncharacterised protein [Serratia proteamaculans]CAI2000119.1 Uncharacterised protein [Serratia proteamaculans]CAI2500994.1 Uncharacterised protein [Serratia proteamaculans]